MGPTVPPAPPAPRRFRALPPVLLPVLLLALLAFPALAQMSAEFTPAKAPASAVVFDVLRDGSKIGEHRLLFEPQDDDTLKVSVETDMSVKFAFLTLFHYEHRRVERWDGAELQSLAGMTNDDGKEYEISIVRKEGHYSRTVNGAEEELDGPVKIDSLWSKDRLTAGKLFSADSADVYRVRSDLLGWETIEARGRSIEAEHVKLTGGLDRDLWYGHGGELLKIQYETKDGERFEYVRR
jgi:Domain of unknown function (DUF6134)